MLSNPKYSGILGNGSQANRRYPYGYIRRNSGKLPGGKSAKIVKMVGFLGAIMMAGNAVGTASGCCDDEKRDLENSMRLFVGSGSQLNCQDVMASLHAFLECAGYDDIPNGLQLQRGIIEVCSECPN